MLGLLPGGLILGSLLPGRRFLVVRGGLLLLAAWRRFPFFLNPYFC